MGEKKPTQGNRKVQVGTIYYVDMATFRKVVPTNSVDPLHHRELGRPGLTHGQGRYLPICRTKKFPTPANFESNLSVQVLMRSENNGTPKYS